MCRRFESVLRYQFRSKSLKNIALPIRKIETGCDTRTSAGHSRDNLGKNCGDRQAHGSPLCSLLASCANAPRHAMHLQPINQCAEAFRMFVWRTGSSFSSISARQQSAPVSRRVAGGCHAPEQLSADEVISPCATAILWRDAPKGSDGRLYSPRWFSRPYLRPSSAQRLSRAASTSTGVSGRVSCTGVPTGFRGAAEAFSSSWSYRVPLALARTARDLCRRRHRECHCGAGSHQQSVRTRA